MLPAFLESPLSSAKEPFFGNPAIRSCDDLIRGFASPPHDGFALLGRPSERARTASEIPPRDVV
jgi:hypothetical protein